MSFSESKLVPGIVRCLQLELTNQVLLYIRKEFDTQPTDEEMGVKEELTKNGIYALQYLAGYIFRNFYKKFK